VASTSAPVPRYRDFSVPQFLVNLRAINTAQGPPTGSALSSEARLAPRLTSAAAGSNGTFTNQVTNDNQDTAATDVIVGSKVSGGTITNCQTTLGTCSVSGDNATVTIAVLPAMQSVTITIFVTGFSCTATICPVQDDLTTLSDQPNADLSASKASSVFLVNGTVAGFPANLTILSGTPQSAPVGTAFANPLQVTVTDALNTLLGNQTVIFTVPTSGASATLSTNTPLTNSSGVASVTAQANGIQGAYTVTAAIPSAS
jgi:hypothetical protein